MTIRYLISGRVQGVGFRWFAREAADGLGLTGYARNLRDRRVEVVAQGKPEILKKLEDQLRSGPPLARVENVDKIDISDEVERLIDFEIRS